MSNELDQAAATYLPWIESELQVELSSSEARYGPYYGMMQYHMGWVDGEFRPRDSNGAGKRIRPLLCLLACAAAGGDPRQAVPAAAGVELLHNFSLIHDDIEDNSPVRRHRPALWSMYGLAQGCNAGDAMFTAAHRAFHRLPALDVPQTVVLAALRIFDDTALALTEGQFLDIAFEQRLDIGEHDYFAMIGGKTAALLGAAPEIGAVIAGADPATAGAYRDYGHSLGIAFQLQDDILGIWGDESVTGKSAVSDILGRKKSLPVLYALSDPATGPRLRALYSGPPLSSEDVNEVLLLLDEVDARGRTRQHVARAAADAFAALDRVAATASAPAIAALRQFLEQMLNRQF